MKLRHALSKRRAICVLLSLILLGSTASFSAAGTNRQASAQTFYVGGSGPGNYSSIQAALDAAQPGDIVFVYDDSSPYYEHLLIQKNGITLKGENKQTTIIDGNGTGTIVTLLKSSCFVLDFTIQHSGTATMDAAVLLQRANLTIIHDLSINNASIGILFTSRSDTGYVHNCTIQESQTGISSVSTSGLLIDTNTIIDCGIGLYCSQGSGISIQSNTIQGKWAGIQLDNLNNSHLGSNTIIGSKNGLTAILCKNLDIGGNTITHARWMNMWIAQCTQPRITGNDITHSDGIGLYITASTESYVSGNLLQGNDDGIILEYSSHSQIKHNTFDNLKNDAFFITKTLKPQNNTWKNNYWAQPLTHPKLIQGRYKYNGHNFPLLTWDPKPDSIPAGTLHQTTNSQVLYVGGTGPGNYTTIQAAIDDAIDGDTIYVYAGHYMAPVAVNKALTLAGEDPSTTIIDGAGYDDGITITHDQCTVSGFNITSGHFGIYALNATTITITANILYSNFHGITLRNAHTITINNNILHNNQYGIRLYDSTKVTVTKNTIHSYKLDAYFIGSTPESCHNTWIRNYWGRPSLIHIIHGKYAADDQAGSPRWNLDYLPLYHPITPGISGKINKEKGGC